MYTFFGPRASSSVCGSRLILHGAEYVMVNRIVMSVTRVMSMFVVDVCRWSSPEHCDAKGTPRVWVSIDSGHECCQSQVTLQYTKCWSTWLQTG